MSGPAPTLAATAVLGLRSSQDCISTLTSQPVFSVKSCVFFMNTISSPATNLAGRMTRKVAPFSTSMAGAVAARARGTRSPDPAKAVPARAPSPIRNVSRRPNGSMIGPP